MSAKVLLHCYKHPKSSVAFSFIRCMSGTVEQMQNSKKTLSVLLQSRMNTGFEELVEQ